VPPFVGHVVGACTIARELSRRGHTVAWVAASSVRRLLPEGDRVFLAGGISQGALAEVEGSAGSQIDAAGFWLALMPMAREMLPAVETAIAEFAPAVLVVDQHAFAGALAARRQDLPWVTLAPTGQPLAPFIQLVPQIEEWLEANAAELQKQVGLEPISHLERSPFLALLLTTPDFVSPRGGPPDGFRLIGPLVDESRVEGGSDFPWDQLRDQRRLLVSLGSVSFLQSQRFFVKLIEAFAAEPLQVIVRAPQELGLDFPDNFIARPWLPQLQLLPQVDAMISHGGANSIREALWFGLPLVVTPMAYDQTIWAIIVSETGVGLSETFSRSTPTKLRTAVYEVLDNPSYRLAAGRIRDSFRAAGGAAAAADAIEAIGR
jgi:MGT family glycosyltransferase